MDDDIVEVQEFFESEAAARKALAQRPHAHIHQIKERWVLSVWMPLECWAGMAEREDEAQRRLEQAEQAPPDPVDSPVDPPARNPRR